jgi:succinate dehydrogenase/fumarate reductase-like Fe-S protein
VADVFTGQIGKILGERWGKLTDKQKIPYENQAKKDKERYELEKAEYTKAVSQCRTIILCFVLLTICYRAWTRTNLLGAVSLEDGSWVNGVCRLSSSQSHMNTVARLEA